MLRVVPLLILSIVFFALIQLLSAAAFFQPVKLTGITVHAATQTPIVRKVQLLIFNPYLPNHGNVRLTAYESWNNPDTITNWVRNSLATDSGNLVTFKIVDRRVINAFPVKADGYQYTETSYLNCLANSSTCHQPDTVNYQKILSIYSSCSELNSGTIDEVWLWGGPYFGYWESTLAGPRAYWYNSSPVTNTTCNKLLPVMGFNYERGNPEALHSMGHRQESTMTQVYGGWTVNTATPWNTFALYDKVFPGQARCGDIHFPPNSVADYDYSNTRYVSSACGDFFGYPNLPNPPHFIQMNCNNWGCTQQGFLNWWFKHMPKASGTTNNVLNNWWIYFADPNRAPH